MKPPADYSHSVAERIKTLVDEGTLAADPQQMMVARRLDGVLMALKSRAPAAKSSALGWLFAKRRGTDKAVRGLYVHGSVGRGKTMLMDMMFELAPVEKKRRAHFHEFMADVHGRIHAHRQKLKNGETRQADPVPPVAAALNAEATLLCFDEFSVTDIADAMILSRLFTELFERGCVLVATSNVAPDDLYRDGLNRQLFLPFIDLLKAHTDVVSLDSPSDYRMEKNKSMPVWLTPLGPESDAGLDDAWDRLTNNASPTHEKIEFRGRTIEVPAAAGDVARFSFADLCEKPYAAADYLELVHRYKTVIVSGIPVLTPQKGNETKRFINLVDTLYDGHVRLIASGEVMPEALLPIRRGTVGFEFDRTVSRLFEMRSQEYLSACG